MRQSVSYCIGGCPTSEVKRSANTERDIPTSRAHANCVENLPAFGAIVFAISAVGLDGQAAIRFH
jgi:hypothetical protein